MAVPAVDRVASGGACSQRVRARAAVNLVEAVFADQQVIALTAVDRVVADAAEDGVRTGPADDAGSSIISLPYSVRSCRVRKSVVLVYSVLVVIQKSRFRQRLSSAKKSGPRT
jgi:hypothetical protein